MKAHREKDRLDAIQIPAALDESVKSGLRKGRRRLALRRTMSGMAAVLAVTFLTANIPPLYARAAEVPLLAPLVRVMRMGSGGQEANGAVARIQSGQDRIQLTFINGEEASVPVFSAVQRQSPRRVILRLHGLEPGKPLGLAEALLKQTAVTDAYEISATDPEEQGVVLCLQTGWSCTVGQYEQALELQFTEGAAEEQREFYTLCSAPLPQGTELAELTELLLWEGATQLRAPSGDFYVVLGEFTSEEMAKRARESLLAAKGAELNVVHVVDGTLQ